MKAALILGFLALAGTAVLLYTQEPQQNVNLRSNDKSLFQEYQQWKSVNHQNTNGEEDKYRFQIFKQNKQIVEQSNAEEIGSLRLGMNTFATLTLEEFVEKYTQDMTTSLEENWEFVEEQTSESYANVPESVDWTAKGAVTAVVNQGECGSCWAFSTKGGLEGAYQIESGNLEQFSAQQLVDCSKFNLGCNGGDPMSAYGYVRLHGIQSEASYPYVSGTTQKAGQCQYKAEEVVYQQKKQKRVYPQNNSDAIMSAAANQPLTIEVSAGNVAFQLYSSGVIDSKFCGTSLDHGVLLTGYDNNTSNPHWIIKNSWGTGWGSEGYGQIALTADGPGMCGIQQYAAYPVLQN